MVFLLAIIAMLAPRFALVLIWVLTPLVNRAFGAFIVPLLGFIFLPFTTLIYSLVYVPAIGGPTGFGWLWVLLAVLVDLGSYGGGAYGSRGRSRQQLDRAA